MSRNHAPVIAGELDLSERSVAAALNLFEEGATIPFVARYRKERTGGLDEVVLRAIRDRKQSLADLDARKQTVLESLKEQGVDDPALHRRIAEAGTRAEVEDLYLPYRPKRRTRAQLAREKGLGPLAEKIRALDPSLRSNHSLEDAARPYVDAEKDLGDVELVLQGARDIVAEELSESPDLRTDVRELFRKEATLRSRPARASKASDEMKAKFGDYLDWGEPARRAPSHRILAVMRGCREGVLSCHVLPDEERALPRVVARVVQDDSRSAVGEQLGIAAADAYRRLLAPQLETELRNELVRRAEEEAVAVFARNLRELLMSPPLGPKAVLALDPGFRTGCKLVVLSPEGDLLHWETIYPLEPVGKTREAARRIEKLVEEHGVAAIAVGNGTGGREATRFCRDLPCARSVVVAMVDESGASVYSASEAARREFPEHDVTVRGAVSIGRRLQDPLAELVKIDPKSIGVGQYQHDVDQKLLAAALNDVVASCVNAVGVEVNTASAALLRYISGISETLAFRIVEYRRSRGRLSNRRELMDVPGLGAKTFELAAGFLRIPDGDNPLDAGAVHPERYPLVTRMARDLGVDTGELLGNAELVSRISADHYVDGEVGLPTIRDILSELIKPGRDPREEFAVVQFAEGVESMDDLSPGMTLPGVVTNVTAFGAFVDIGVHNDGLVHISKMARHFVSDPHEVVKVHQHVEVTVISVDKNRGRIGLSMVEGGSDE